MMMCPMKFFHHYILLFSITLVLLFPWVNTFQCNVGQKSPLPLSPTEKPSLFSASPRSTRSPKPYQNAQLFATTLSDRSDVNAIDTNGDEVESIKQEIYRLAEQTSRGFQANDLQRRCTHDLITDLARLYIANHPARAFYDSSSVNCFEKDSNEKNSTCFTLQGKWELVYTDAPDITTLDQNPLATLGRIGQECSSPFIKNVIEWKQPEWAERVPFLSGRARRSTPSTYPRVLLKVVTSAMAQPQQPTKVNLQVAGIQIETDLDEDNMNQNNKSVSLKDRIRRNGVVVGLLKKWRNVDWVSNAQNRLPFGSFDIVYLDENLRITRTSQNHITVNKRLNETSAWF